jgi:crossover junction endodeoxyribonuclease RuvC
MTILGLDPGTATTGYGIVEKQGNKITWVEHGVIQTDKDSEMPDRLLVIYTQLNRLLDVHEPDVIAMEKLFFGNNVTTALLVGRSVGVMQLTAAQRGIPLFEYRPVEVKVAIAGYGGAEKKQVQYMVQQFLGLEKMPKPDDAADALALAICHAHSAPFAALNKLR